MRNGRDTEHMQVFSGAKRRGRRGAALFIAISMLALFSALGASYVRFMSLEIEESNLRLRAMRVRHYAGAGVYSAMGSINEALSCGMHPASSYTYSYGMYGLIQGAEKSVPALLNTYNAQSQVAVAVITEDGWNERFPDGPLWPGEAQAFEVVSQARLQRAGPGRMIHLAAHSVTAVLVAQSDCCAVIFWSHHKDTHDVVSE